MSECDLNKKRLKLVHMRNSSDENVAQENFEFREMFLTYTPGDKKQDSEVEETELKDQIIIEDVREVEVENFKQLLEEARKFSETSNQARVPLRLKECDGTSRNIVNDEDFQELDDGTEIMVEISTPPTLPFLKVNRREAKDAPDEETLKSVLTARLMKFPDLMEFMTQREMKLLITANSQLEPEAGIDLQEKLQQKLDVRRLLKEGVDIITKDFIIPTRKFKSKEKKILAVLKHRNIPKILVSDRLFECSRCDTEGDADTLIYKLLRRPKLISNLNSKKLETVAYSDLSRVRAPRIVSYYVKNACTIRLREILRSNLIEAFLEMQGETIGV